MYDDYNRRYDNVRQGAYGRTQTHDGRGYSDRGIEPYREPSMRHYEHERGGYSDMSRGELRAFIMEVMREQADEMFAEQGYYRGEQGGDQHKRFKEALEKLREIPSIMEATKHFPKYFEGLTEEERKVLTQLAQKPSLKKQAQSAGMTPERFCQLKHELMYKLKD